MLEDAFDAMTRRMMFCLPGRITTFDAETQRAQIEFGIQPVINGTPRQALTADNVPVQFAGDNEWYHWHQITPGETEGIIVFSQRNMEQWKQAGGPAAPADRRTFSGGDAMFVPGVRSLGNAIPNLATSGAGISNYAGDTHVTLTDASLVAEKSGSTVTLTDSDIVAQVGSSTITVTGSSITLQAGGQTFTLSSAGANHNGTNIGDTHTHPQGPDSDGNSEQDTGPPK